MENGVIAKGEVLSDNNEQQWIVDAFIGVNGRTNSYQALSCNHNTPADFNKAILLIVPSNGDEPLPLDFLFYLDHAKPKNFDDWRRVTKIKQHLGIPCLLGTGSHVINDDNYRFIVIHGHGQNLLSLFLENDKKFKEHTAYKIALQLITILKYTHTKLYIHGDIRSSNIVLDIATRNKIYLMDDYKTLQNSTNDDPVDSNKTCDVAVVISSRDSDMRAQTMRGDMETLFYNLVQWLGIELPWKKNLEDPSLVLKEKENAFANVQSWSQEMALPAPVLEFMELLARMDTNDKPQYSTFIRILKEGLKKLHHVPYGKLEFCLSDVLAVEEIENDSDEMNKPQRRHKKLTAIPKLRNSVQKIAGIISENCRHEGEVKLREVGPGSLIEIICDLTTRRKDDGEWQNRLANAWERDTADLKTITKRLWRQKKLQAEEIIRGAASTDNQHGEPSQESTARAAASTQRHINGLNNSDPGASNSQSPDGTPSQEHIGLLGHRNTSSPNDFQISNESIVEYITEVIVVESKQEDNGSDKEVIECDKSESVDCNSWQDKYNMLNAWLKMKEQNFGALGSIPSEPQMIIDQVSQVRVLLEEFRHRLRLRQLNALKRAISKLLPSSDDFQKIEQVERSWQKLLDRLVKRAHELGDTSLDQLSKALLDVSNKLKKLLLDKLSEEQLLTELNVLAEHLKSAQRTLLANTQTSVDQLCRALRNLTVKSELRNRLLRLKNFDKQLQNKIENKTDSIQNSLVERREFDKLCKETDDWLVKELANVLLVPTDREKLQQQYEDYKVEHQLIMDRETEVMELLKRGRDPARLRNTTQRQFLDLIESRWNQLTKKSHDIVNKLNTCAKICDEFYEKQDCFLRWLNEAECKLESFKLASLDSIEKQLKKLYEFRDEVQGKSAEFEQTMSLGETFISACEDNNDLKNELSAAKNRWTNLNFDLLNRLKSFEDMNEDFADFNKSLLDLQQKIEPYEKESASHDALEATAKDSKLLHRVRELEKQVTSLQKPLDAVRQKADGLVLKAREQGINVSHLWGVVNPAIDRIENCKTKLRDIRDRLQEEIQKMKPVESRDSFSKERFEMRQGGDFETNSPRRSEKKSEITTRKRRIQSKDSHKNNKYDDARLNSDTNPFIRKRFKNSQDDFHRNSRISRYEGSRQETPYSRNRRTHYDSDGNPSRSSDYRRHWRTYRSRRPVYDSRSGSRSRSPGRNQTWDVQQKQPFKNIARKNSVYGQATRARYRRRGWEPDVAIVNENGIHVKSDERFKKGENSDNQLGKIFTECK